MSQSVFCLARVEASGVKLLGTAFAIGNDRIATAAHVVDGSDTNLALIIPRQKNLLDYQDATETVVQHTPVRIHAIDPIRDLCILALEDGHADVTFQLGTSDDLEPGMPTYVYGFPHANTGRWILNQDIAYVGARIFAGTAGLKNKHVVLNILSRPGHSGAPVFRTDKPLVAAIVVGAYASRGGGGIIIGGIDPQTLHQTTQAVSAEYLQEMQ